MDLNMPSKDALPDDNPQWYRDALIYQLHVKAFHDSDGNGIGDFRGLMEKLDYLHDLGITAVWLLPFYPSRRASSPRRRSAASSPCSPRVWRNTTSGTPNFSCCFSY
jgi:pullulanase/glycogen debranching enzyme